MLHQVHFPIGAFSEYSDHIVMLIKGPVKALDELPRVELDCVERGQGQSAEGGLSGRAEHYRAVYKDLGVGAKATHILIRRLSKAA